MEEFKNHDHRQNIYSKVIKKDTKTFFLDVKATKHGQQYVTVTESNKKFDQTSGRVKFDKRKIYLYREDFEVFQEALAEVIQVADSNNEKLYGKPDYDKKSVQSEPTSLDISFEDLGKEK